MAAPVVPAFLKHRQDVAASDVVSELHEAGRAIVHDHMIALAVRQAVHQLVELARLDRAAVVKHVDPRHREAFVTGERGVDGIGVKCLDALAQFGGRLVQEGRNHALPDATLALQDEMNGRHVSPLQLVKPVGRRVLPERNLSVSP